MDSASAALVGASIGMTGAVLAALANGIIAGRNGRREKSKQVRRSAYERAVEALHGIGHYHGNSKLTPAILEELSLAHTRIAMSGSLKCLQSFEMALGYLREVWRRGDSSEKGVSLCREEYEKMLMLTENFIATVRADLGLRGELADWATQDGTADR